MSAPACAQGRRRFLQAALAATASLPLAKRADASRREGIDLVRAGRPLAAIVLASEPSPAAVTAARELQRHLAMITGATLPIAGETVAATGPRILVGFSHAAAALGVTPAGLRPEEWIVAQRPGAIILAGDDAAVHVANDEPPPLFAPCGSLAAVYDFLERECDVRWFLPGELGTIVRRTSTLRAAVVDRRHAPAMRYRFLAPARVFVDDAAHPFSASELAWWMRRLRLGGERYTAGHSLSGYVDRFAAAHPDWFAEAGSERPRQLCLSNPALVAQVVRDARAYFDTGRCPTGAMAEGDYFAVGPLDNIAWCRCAECARVLAQSADDNPQFSNGRASDYVFGFVNAVAAELAKSHPHRFISALAYSDYAYCPRRVTLLPNVAVQLCLTTRSWWVPAMARNDLKILDEWRRESSSRRLFARLYLDFPALSGRDGGFDVFPGFFAHTAAAQMKLLLRAHIRGIFVEHSSEFDRSLLLDCPELLVTLRMADAGPLDGDAFVDDYFARSYGRAGDAMRAFYDTIEEAYSRPTSYPEAIRTTRGFAHQTEAIAWGALGTRARMATLERLLERARSEARLRDERERIEQVRRAIWVPMLRGMRAHRPAPTTPGAGATP